MRNDMKKIFMILVVGFCLGNIGCGSSRNQNPAGGPQQSSNPSQGTGGVSGSSVTGGTGGIDPETPGGASIEPYRPCALHPCAQRLPDPETDEDLKYSLPK